MGRGQIRKEALLLVGGVFLAIAIVGLLWQRMSARETFTAEGERMRQIYINLSIYEGQFDGQLPSALPQLEFLLAPKAIYSSAADPYRDATGPFPVDAGLPDRTERSEFRISDSYLYAHVAAGKLKVGPWAESRFDPSLGLLANEFLGGVKAQGDFRARVSGPVLRVNTDGSLSRVQRAGESELGDAETLFRRPSSRL